MLYGVLGPLTVHDGAGQPVTVREAKVRTLLAALLTHGGGPVSPDLLIDCLWGSALPGRPRNTLQTKVSLLRRGLGDGQLVHEPGGYRLRLTPDALDADRFERLVAQARSASDPGGKDDLLTTALGLWRGSPYSDVADVPFVRGEAVRLGELRLAAVEERAAARLALGGHAALAEELGGWVAEHPLREGLRATHMRALYRSGRQHEALHSFLGLQRRLAEELGVDPGQEMTRLYQAILRQSPELDAPTPDSRPAVWASAGQSPSAAEDGAVTVPPGAGSAGCGTAPPAPEAGPPGPADGACCCGNLPAPLTRLIGRQSEVADVHALLSQDSLARLVTLSGPGGVGKTRLAIAAARELAPSAHPDGVWLVELAGLRGGATPDEVADRVISALGLCDAAASVPETTDGMVGQLATLVESRRTLVVLDNSEHVVEAVAEVATALLAAATGLRILVTGQEPLGVLGEIVRQVAPLPLPPLLEAGRGDSAGAAEGCTAEGGTVREAHAAHGTDPADDTDGSLVGSSARSTSSQEDLKGLTAVATAGAVRLFMERAAAAVPGFVLHEGNAAAVAAICRRLDGIPLALELVAARLPVLPPDELLECLNNRFRLPTASTRGLPPRQRTLQAMIDWSWDLLTEDQRAVLRRLSVTADGCSLYSAQQLCSGLGVSEDGVLDALARLVDRSLVVRDGDRFRLLESVAAYGAERLVEAGEATDVTERFVAHAVSIAEEAAGKLRGPRQHDGLMVLDQEAVNLRRALDLAVEVEEGGSGTSAGHAVRLVNALAWYWFLRSRTAEARRWLHAALGTGGGSPEDRAVARAWLADFTLRTDATASDRHTVAHSAVATVGSPELGARLS